ncbi:uncharacterized protein STEHIDRAFT_112621 [Stereum hirsutum FP-91666 SS1]|uniref:uncharacterized protein n=1 Tax=Stereum hirsutum (strain FP-91666) TaxID=721885 RepID=UPI000444A071|nr:uncharacterized protein STEHIDRAFT_112621 [Stereum hirsutum FP-91666 SS1]EIM85175.1 hypothetical protein STEHIDRAFT_112621 [Stereum hirsutum FP-91666 SS1]
MTSFRDTQSFPLQAVLPSPIYPGETTIGESGDVHGSVEESQEASPAGHTFLAMKLSPTMFHPDAFSYGSQSTPIKLEERSGRPTFQSSAPHFPLGEPIYSREIYLYYHGELCHHYTILFTLGGLPEANCYASDRYTVSYTELFYEDIAKPEWHIDLEEKDLRDLCVFQAKVDQEKDEEEFAAVCYSQEYHWESLYTPQGFMVVFCIPPKEGGACLYICTVEGYN